MQSPIADEIIKQIKINPQVKSTIIKNTLRSMCTALKIQRRYDDGGYSIMVMNNSIREILNLLIKNGTVVFVPREKLKLNKEG